MNLKALLDFFLRLLGIRMNYYTCKVMSR